MSSPSRCLKLAHYQKLGILSITEVLVLYIFNRDLWIPVYIFIWYSLVLEPTIIFNIYHLDSNYNTISVIWMHKHCAVLSYSLELENLVQETVSERFFKNDMYWLLKFYWRRLLAKSNMSENAIFQFSKIWW